MIRNSIGLLAFAFLIVQQAFSQGSKLKSANRNFDNISYVEAIRNYEYFLHATNKKTPEVKEALTKLAFSYRRVLDYANAERIYAELVNTFDNELDSEVYLYYAQALASNGKYRESQKMYNRYGQEQTADMRGRKFTVAYMDNNRFYEDSASYKVDYLHAVNSRQSDFSPAFYKNALVFVSAREEGGLIKRVFMQNQTPFLDLYVFPDTAQLTRDNLVMKKAGTANAPTMTTGNAAENPTEEKEEKTLTKVEQFSRTLNTKYHEGPLTFFKDYKKLIFTSNNRNKKNRTGSDDIIKLKLYMASESKQGWGDIVELPFNSNEYSCGHPALSPDNTMLYFSSDMPGGFGGTDIYVSHYRNGEWSAPENLGREINTEGNEMFPFIDAGGNLYFASDGHEGLGGLDIFFVELFNNKAGSEVKNLGAPINSPKDDFGLITDARGSRGYFSSNRRRGYSDDNLYSYTRSYQKIELLVYDADTKKPLENVQVRLLKNGKNKDLLTTAANGLIKTSIETGAGFEFKTIKEGYEPSSITFNSFTNSIEDNTSLTLYLKKPKANTPIIKGTILAEVNQQPIEGAIVTLHNDKGDAVQTVMTGADGKYEFQPAKEGEYSVTAIKDHYAVNTENIGRVKAAKKDLGSTEQNLGLIGEGDIFRLDNIYYNYGKVGIRPDAARELDKKLVPLLTKYPEMRIEIRSHTDSRSSDDFNMKLSEDRALAVAVYLAERGISTDRLQARGFGETQLLNNCENGVDCSETQHQFNRRTEFKILCVSVSMK